MGAFILKTKNILLLIGVLFISSVSFHNCSSISSFFAKKKSKASPQISAKNRRATRGIASIGNPAQKVTKADDFKLAIISETSNEDAFRERLRLVSNEGAHALVINGGFTSTNQTQINDTAPPSLDWITTIQEEIDISEIAVLGAFGNHALNFEDTEASEISQSYIDAFFDLKQAHPFASNACSGENEISLDRDTTLVNELCLFDNVTIITSSIGSFSDTAFSNSYFENALEDKLSTAPIDNWKLAIFHHTVAPMNTGNDSIYQNSYPFFETIRQYGAVGVQSHNGSTMSTCPISSEFIEGQELACDTNPINSANERWLRQGTGLFIDSSTSNQDFLDGSCVNADSPCTHIIDHLSGAEYIRRDQEPTSIPDASNGAGVLFIVFNLEGPTPTSKPLLELLFSHLRF